MQFYEINRALEHYVQQIGGRKVLYAHTYYSKEEFWQIYDGKQYQALRSKYKADRIFPDIYEKVFVSETYTPRIIGGLIDLLKEKIMRNKSNV